MSMPSSPVEDAADDDEAVEVDDERDMTSAMVHCSSTSIIWTSRAMSRTCDELHCMRELDWRCIRSSEAETREYVGRGAYCTGQVRSVSINGDGRLEQPSWTAVSMRRLCWLSFEAKSPTVQGGVVGRVR